MARDGSTRPAWEQPGLFGDDAPPGPPRRDDLAERLARAHAGDARVAALLPSRVRFGTSSWSFPGWAGLVYPRRASAAALARDGLAEYARGPLFRTVGIDRSFYAPVPEADLARYAESLPSGFLACAKAPEAVTSPVRLTFGAKGPPERNPDYLSCGRLVVELLDPFRRAFLPHAGPFLFQFPPPPAGHALAPQAFAERLASFLDGLPRDLPYAIELRDPTLLTEAYRQVLAHHRVAHVYNYATAMPPAGAQAVTLPLDLAPHVVVRLLLRPGTRYGERKEAFAPFDRLVDPAPEMRADVADLVARAARAGRSVFVLVNNKAEGSAPLTIRALAPLVADLLLAKPPEEAP